ncbi:MAG: hypothetical protein IT514_10175 [Burkholderiales bacterium]|nr:hypothetical protein [Burkholderiales bacterium]
MIFSLEVRRARKGERLLLQFGARAHYSRLDRAGSRRCASSRRTPARADGGKWRAFHQLLRQVRDTARMPQ